MVRRQFSREFKLKARIHQTGSSSPLASFRSSADRLLSASLAS